MNFTNSVRKLALCLLVLLSLSGLAFSQDQFSSDSILKSTILSVQRAVDTANKLAVDTYKLLYDNFRRNVANHPELASNPPVAPTVTVFDAEVFSRIFTTYNTTCAVNSAIGDPCGELDYSASFSKKQYPEIKPDVKPVTQPDNPIGVKIGKGVYGSAPGDTKPDGAEFTDEATGISYRKFVIEGPFGDHVGWKVIN